MSHISFKIISFIGNNVRRLPYVILGENERKEMKICSLFCQQLDSKCFSAYIYGWQKFV